MHEVTHICRMSRKLVLSLLLSTSLFAAACTPGDEALPEDQLVILGQSLTDLARISTITGNYFEGVAAFEDCNYVPVISGGCAGLQYTQGLVDEQIDKNTVLVMELRDNVITGRLHLAVPHFNAAPNTYTVGVTGTTSLSTDSNLTVLTLTQASVTPNVIGPNLDMALAAFRAEQRDGDLVGNMQLTLTQTGIADVAKLTYGFTLKKKL